MRYERFKQITRLRTACACFCFTDMFISKNKVASVARTVSSGLFYTRYNQRDDSIFYACYKSVYVECTACVTTNTVTYIDLKGCMCTANNLDILHTIFGQ